VLLYVIMKLRIPAALVVSVIASCGDNNPQKIDAQTCAIDAPKPDSGVCIPCGDPNGGSACDGTCVDGCFQCPPGCEPLV